MWPSSPSFAARRWPIRSLVLRSIKILLKYYCPEQYASYCLPARCNPYFVKYAGTKLRRSSTPDYVFQKFMIRAACQVVELDFFLKSFLAFIPDIVRGVFQLVD